MFPHVADYLRETKTLPATPGLSAAACNLNPAGGAAAQIDQIDDRIERLGLAVEALWEILKRRGVTEPELDAALTRALEARYEAEKEVIVCPACGSRAPEARDTCQICGAQIPGR